MSSPAVVISSMTFMAFTTLWCRLVYYRTHGGSLRGSTALTEDYVHHALVTLYGLTAYCFYHSMFDQPGYLPRGWRPEKRRAEKLLEYCKPCKGYKAPRAHHCRRCGFCVRRMDHHCGFLNNCIGIYNHAHFLGFLVSWWAATALSLYVIGTVLVVGYREPGMFCLFREARENRNYRSLEIYAVCLSFAFGFLIILPLISSLLFVQLRNLALNVTVLERTTYAEAHRAHVLLVNPYDMGVCSNFRQVPLFKRMNGVDYPLRYGVSKYALVDEQRRQKEELSSGRSGKRVKVVKSYEGSVLPVKHGCGTVVNSPLAFESRLDVNPGEEIVVSRQTDRWAYGHKRDGSRSGWVPKDCVEDISQEHAQASGQQQQEHGHRNLPSGWVQDSMFPSRSHYHHHRH